MFRINPFKPSREEKYVPNKVISSVRTNPITVSQPHVITKKDVNTDSNGLSSIGVDNTAKTRRPQPRSSTKNDRVPYTSKSSCSKNKDVEVEKHPRNLLFSKNKKHMSYECNNVKLAIRNDKSEVVCGMCKQCLITANHDVCVLNYVNDMNSRGKKQKANVLNTENQKKQKPKVMKPKKEGSNERLASPKPSKLRSCLRWSPTGRLFDLKGKIIASSESESQSDYSNGFIQHLFMFLGTVRFGNDHVAAILGFGDLQWGNILITRVYFVEGLGHKIVLGGQFCARFRVEQRNRTLVEAARTMLIFFRAPLFLWAEAIATACYTQNCSVIHRRFNKTPYKLINGRKLDISFLHVFGALCYPENDREDIGKLGAKGDIVFFIGYSADSCAYRVYNRRTKKIMETMNVTFDELLTMAFKQSSLKPGLQSMAFGQITMHDDYIGGQPSAALRTGSAAQAPQVLQTPTATTTTSYTAPTPMNSSSQATTLPNTS
ncbi:integrase, catalytic region, zinc finger, CCHC-type containing protein [Tanacetum coccineum]